MDYQTIGDICNYYGHLNVKQEGDQFYWGNRKLDGEYNWEEIPKYLFEALNKFETERNTEETSSEEKLDLEEFTQGILTFIEDNSLDLKVKYRRDIGIEGRGFLITVESKFHYNINYDVDVRVTRFQEKDTIGRGKWSYVSWLEVRGYGWQPILTLTEGQGEWLFNLLYAKAMEGLQEE